MSANAELAERFSELADLSEILGANAFKVLAFRKVARALEALAEDVASIAGRPGELEAIEGIGASSAAKIRERLATGAIAELEELRAKVPPGVPALLGLSGLGPKTVKILWEEGGVVDLASLKAKLEEGSLASLPRMGKKTLENIRQSIELAERSVGRIRLGDAVPIAEGVVAVMRRVPGVARAEAAGSVRRGRETIGDLDILCATDDPQPAHAAFRELPGLAKVLASGDTKTSVVTERGVQMDLRTLPTRSFGAALLYFTGSKEHNVRLRERAIARGFRLNEYGLFTDDGKDAPQHRGVTPVVSDDEASIYARLELPFIPPEIREDRGEFERPATAPRLIELTDLKAELHAHTTASDGLLTIDELVEAAAAKGYHTIAITDHSKSSVQANGLSPERLREHIRAVRDAAKRHPRMQVLAGSEVDILADGRLDYDDELLAELDIVVASPHTALKQEPAAATKRLLAAIRHPAVRILGHPTGRIINGREGLSPDMPEIVAAAREHDVALEINANPLRLDLRDIHVRLAVEAGCLLSINCDSHQREHLDFARYGIATGRRGWLTPEQCVNCWDRARLAAWVRRG